MTETLITKIKEGTQEAIGTTLRFIPRATFVLLGLYACAKTIDGNGLGDSMRTKSANDYHNKSNPVKVVAKVEEEWNDNTIYSPDMTGFNPVVDRTITFEDGTKTSLHYRTLAWQPFKEWVSGEEFKPQVGERYEVTSGGILRTGRPENELVRRVN